MSYLNCENANIPEHVRGFLSVFLCVKKKKKKNSGSLNWKVKLNSQQHKMQHELARVSLIIRNL
jgi:hypothetical protein